MKTSNLWFVLVTVFMALALPALAADKPATNVAAAKPPTNEVDPYCPVGPADVKKEEPKKEEKPAPKAPSKPKAPKPAATKPKVRIELPDSAPIKENGGSASIKIVRDNGTGKALEVNLSVGGNADNGTDYEKLPNKVTIAAGESSKTVVIKPIADDKDEGPETVTVEVKDGDGYEVGDPSTQTVVITDREKQAPAPPPAPAAPPPVPKQVDCPDGKTKAEDLAHCPEAPPASSPFSFGNMYFEAGTFLGVKANLPWYAVGATGQPADFLIRPVATGLWGIPQLTVGFKDYDTILAVNGFVAPGTVLEFAHDEDLRLQPYPGLIAGAGFTFRHRENEFLAYGFDVEAVYHASDLDFGTGEDRLSSVALGIAPAVKWTVFSPAPGIHVELNGSLLIGYELGYTRVNKGPWQYPSSIIAMPAVGIGVSFGGPARPGEKKDEAEKK